MLSYAQVQQKPRILNSLIGLKPDEFEALLPSFESAWQDYLQQQFIAPPRHRRYGGGRKPHLQTTADKLLFTASFGCRVERLSRLGVHH